MINSDRTHRDGASSSECFIRVTKRMSAMVLYIDQSIVTMVHRARQLRMKLCSFSAGTTFEGDRTQANAGRMQSVHDRQTRGEASIVWTYLTRGK